MSEIKYFVWRCPKCGFWDTSFSKKEIKSLSTNCKRCSRTVKWLTQNRHYSGPQVNFYGPFFHPDEARAIIQERLKYEATDKYDKFVAEISEFETYEIN